jgi:hypothetical protein
MRRISLFLSTALFFGTALISDSPHSFCAVAPAYIGVLTPFYRSMQLQGHLIGLGLTEIPDYLIGSDIDFTYKKKPGAKLEIPFVDSFTINRFLGGYREDWLKKFNLWDDRLGLRSLDYVIRNENGTLQYRPELIERRLAPYLEAGYRPEDITLALENVPWDLPKSPVAGNWGQKAPPGDLREWSTVISHFASDLKTYLGASASAVSFKTGVEYDEKASFDGTADDFFAYYAATDAGLHAVLPNAALGPGEFTGMGVCPVLQTTCVYDTSNFLRFANVRHLRINDVPRSLHSFLKTGAGVPSEAVSRAVESYARLPPGVVAEIHQFGLLNEPFETANRNDPAALQANFEFQVLMGIWEKLKPRRVFHWGGIVEVGKLKFLNGSGFVRLVLDHYLGWRAFRLDPQETDPSRIPRRTELIAIDLKNSNSSAVIISSFSPMMSKERRKISVELPSTPRGGALRTIRYRASDNVYSAIRDDLARESNLKSEFVDCSLCLAPPVMMASDLEKARSMLHKNWIIYQTIMKRDLKWNSNDHEVSLKDRELDATLEANELLVIQTP